MYANLKRIKKQYLLNEDKNLHEENYLLLAENFGTKQEIEKVKRILKRNKKLGYILSDSYYKENFWMYNNINKYYDFIRNIEVYTIKEVI